MSQQIDLEEYGKIKDRIDSALAMFENHFMPMQIQKDGVISILREISSDIKQNVKAISGDDPWDYEEQKC